MRRAVGHCESLSMLTAGRCSLVCIAEEDISVRDEEITSLSAVSMANKYRMNECSCEVNSRG